MSYVYCHSLRNILSAVPLRDGFVTAGRVGNFRSWWWVYTNSAGQQTPVFSLWSQGTPTTSIFNSPDGLWFQREIAGGAQGMQFVTSVASQPDEVTTIRLGFKVQFTSGSLPFIPAEAKNFIELMKGGQRTSFITTDHFTQFGTQQDVPLNVEVSLARVGGTNDLAWTLFINNVQRETGTATGGWDTTTRRVPDIWLGVGSTAGNAGARWRVSDYYILRDDGVAPNSRLGRWKCAILSSEGAGVLNDITQWEFSGSSDLDKQLNDLEFYRTLVSDDITRNPIKNTYSIAPAKLVLKLRPEEALGPRCYGITAHLRVWSTDPAPVTMAIKSSQPTDASERTPVSLGSGSVRWLDLSTNKIGTTPITDASLRGLTYTIEGLPT